MNTMEFTVACDAFVKFASQMVVEHRARTCPAWLANVDVTAEPGRRYVRLVRTEYDKDGKVVSRSAHAFVDSTNGDILKPDGWKRPAKGALGNVYQVDSYKMAVTPYGAAYFRR